MLRGIAEFKGIESPSNKPVLIALFSNVLFAKMFKLNVPATPTVRYPRDTDVTYFEPDNKMDVAVVKVVVNVADVPLFKIVCKGMTYSCTWTGVMFPKLSMMPT